MDVDKFLVFLPYDDILSRATWREDFINPTLYFLYFIFQSHLEVHSHFLFFSFFHPAFRCNEQNALKVFSIYPEQ